MIDDGFGEEPWDKDWESRDFRAPWNRQEADVGADDYESFGESLLLKPSLTPNAMQLNWRVPTEFPLCPSLHLDMPLQQYLEKLSPNALFCKNNVYKSYVLKAELSLDGRHISVLAIPDGMASFALSEITFKDGKYIHENIRSFFSEDGAEKYYTISLGKEWIGGDVLEDYCSRLFHLKLK